MKLKKYFDSNDYKFIYSSYGKTPKADLGIGIAYPIKHYNLLDGNIQTICESKKLFDSNQIHSNSNITTNTTTSLYFPSSLNQITSTIFESFNNLFNNFFSNQTRNVTEESSLGLTSDSCIYSIWSEVESRPNEMMTLELQPSNSPPPSPSSPPSSTSTNQSFYVSTYHMPCVYYNPSVMAIHSCLATQHLQRLAQSKPYIFAGDFNIRPTEIVYKFLTTGQIKQSNDSNYNPLNSKDWKLQMNPMRSCYFVSLGKEPEFTNNTWIDEKKFCETIDYIFISPHWTVKDTLKIEPLKSSKITYPNEFEPSDHVMIATELDLID